MSRERVQLRVFYVPTLLINVKTMIVVKTLFNYKSNATFIEHREHITRTFDACVLPFVLSFDQKRVG